MLSAAPLKRVTPESKGVSSRALLELIQAMDATDNEVHGFMLERDGVVLAESWLAPYRPEYPHTCHSLGKSYTCTAVGIACTEGLLSPEDLIVDIFADEIALYGITPDPLYKTLKLRDMMCMGDGMERMPTFDTFWVENYLRAPLKYAPGTHFMYNTLGSCVLGAIVEKVTGMGAYEYLKEKLFGKIGIGDEDLIWLHFNNGVCAEPGLSATTEANLRMGMFYLADGVVGGETIIASEWLKEATSPQIPDPCNGAFDRNTSGYGWQLWLGNFPGQFRFDGGQGQLMIADKPHNAVCAFHQAGRDPEGCATVTGLVQRFLTNMGDGTPIAEDPEGYAALQAYLNSRALPDNEIAPIPANAKKWEGVYGLKEGHPYFWLEVCPGGDDFYHNFYDPAIKRETETIAFAFEGEYLLMTVNSRSVFKLRLDGKLETAITLGVMPGMDKSCGTACFEDENTLVVRLRYLNGWSTSTTRFQLSGADLTIDVDKDMLHEGKPHVKQYGVARRIW